MYMGINERFGKIFHSNFQNFCIFELNLLKARELEEHINIFKRNCNLRIGGNKHKKYQFKRLDTSPT